MNKKLRIAGAAACFAALLVMSGGHWIALQSWAWVRMTIEFCQQDSLPVALVKSFGGRHPCALCLKVQKGWQEEQQQEQKTPWLQWERLPEMAWTFRFLDPPVPLETPAPEGVFATEYFYSFSESPPTPPPRA